MKLLRKTKQNYHQNFHLKDPSCSQFLENSKTCFSGRVQISPRLKFASVEVFNDYFVSPTGSIDVGKTE